MRIALSWVLSAFSAVAPSVALLLAPRGARAEVAADPPVPDRIEFNRDVRPILSESCYACHGFDKAKRKADLRLDTRDGLLKKLDDGPAVAPGKPAASQVYARVISDDPEEAMPPPAAKKPPLTVRQKAVLKKWIEQGAPWEDHWAYTPVRRPAVPAVKQQGWVRNPVDAFVLARLERENLAPAPEADKTTLIRRATLDLTGLPPTPAEVDAFLADPAPDAYEKVVDRLTSSVRYGERLALDWLDAARYADTHGYHIDAGRDQTRWREWVIEAFRANKPYDAFTVEQLAGDLLPDSAHPGPTTDQLVASGFNRNHMVNFEGGAIPEEYRTAYVLDRTNTTGTVWLGLTVGCTQCHDHKFDPVSQREYYGLYAFFNNVDERGLDGSKGNAAPVLAVPDAGQRAKLDALTTAVATADAAFAGPHADADAAQAAWEADRVETARAGGSAERKVEWHTPEPTSLSARGGATFARQPDGSYLAAGPIPDRDAYTVTLPIPADMARVTGVRLEVLPDPSLPANGPGRSENGNAVLTRFAVAVARGPAGGGGPTAAKPEPVAVAQAAADFSQKDFDVATAVDGGMPVGAKPAAGTKGKRASAAAGGAAAGWALIPEVGKPHAATFAFAESVVVGTGRSEQSRDRKGATGSSGSDRASGSPSTPSLPDGRGSDKAGPSVGGEARLVVTLAFESPFARHQFGRFRLSLTDAPNPVPPPEPPADVRAALDLVPRARSDAQRAAVRDYFRRSVWPGGKGLADRAAAARAERDAFERTVPTAMVMRELAKPRETRVFVRGEYDKPGDPVTPGTPAFLPPLRAEGQADGGSAGGRAADRLALARWLVRRDHPLTARVTVNRYWQLIFGTGLVKTSDDFGSQGELPTHPELLDWLAAEFLDGPAGDNADSTGQAGRWNVRHLLRLYVTSATYRQASAVPPALLARDPENRLLARGTRHRMQAELIRDQALAAGGLLDGRVGGASVFPYQPPGLWEELMSRGDGANWTAQTYTPSHGPDLYRRTMYTFWKRTSPPPSLATFDAPDRETCTVRRGRTNTPLQALVLMNDPTYVEAARKLAERALTEPPADAPAADRVALAFRLVLARPPSPAEATVLADVLAAQRAKYAADPAAAAKLLGVGESKPNDRLDPAELAAWVTVCGVVLNLDEAVTRG